MQPSRLERELLARDGVVHQCFFFGYNDCSSPMNAFLVLIVMSNQSLLKCYLLVSDMDSTIS